MSGRVVISELHIAPAAVKYDKYASASSRETCRKCYLADKAECAFSTLASGGGNCDIVCM